MKKKILYLSIFNLLVAVLMISSLMCYIYHKDIFSYILAFSLFLALGVEGLIYAKILNKEPQIKKVPIYKATSLIVTISELILIIGVWTVRLR